MANSSWWKYTFWKSVRPWAGPAPAPMVRMSKTEICELLSCPQIILHFWTIFAVAIPVADLGRGARGARLYLVQCTRHGLLVELACAFHRLPRIV